MFQSLDFSLFLVSYLGSFKILTCSTSSLALTGEGQFGVDLRSGAVLSHREGFVQVLFVGGDLFRYSIVDFGFHVQNRLEDLGTLDFLKEKVVYKET